MLIRFDPGGLMVVQAEVAVEFALLDVAIAECGGAGLHRDSAIVRPKGLLVKHGVEIHWPDGKPFEQRVLRQGRGREQPDREAEAQNREGVQELMGPTGLGWVSVWHVVWRE